MVRESAKASAFCLSGVDEAGREQEFCLKDFLGKGKEVVLYFYPKDNTPGCTTEACDFRDNINRLAAKAAVLGVSPDSVASHMKFREKHDLNFPLLSDPDRKVLKAYGAWGEKKLYGKITLGVIRTTCIIDSSGTVRKVWTNVKVKGHVDEVLAQLG